MGSLMTLPIAEEAEIDREMESKVAKIIAGSADDADRRAYNELVKRRTHLVQQMAISIHSHRLGWVRRTRKNG